MKNYNKKFNGCKGVETSGGKSGSIVSYGKVSAVSAVSCFGNGKAKSSVPQSGIHEYVSSQMKCQSAVDEDIEENAVKPFISENKPPLDVKRSLIVSEHRINRNIRNVNMSFKSAESENLLDMKGNLDMNSFRELDKNSFISSSDGSNLRQSRNLGPEPESTQ